MDDIIDEWFQRHFNHVTPGTADFAVLQQAVTDLKSTLAPRTPAKPTKTQGQE